MTSGSSFPEWSRLRDQWPNASLSRFVTSGNLRWHVQVGGVGPVVVLVHGTGAASFSWGEVLPHLLPHVSVVVPDLPGHGFTTAPDAGVLTLPGMATALGELLATLEMSPVAVVGHSAGAAVLLRLSLDGRLPGATILGFNPALVPPPEVYRSLLAPLVHRVAGLRQVAMLAARLAGRQDAQDAQTQDAQDAQDAYDAKGAKRAKGAGLVASLLRASNSRIPAANIALYETLFRSPEHDHNVLRMMAGWSLTELVNELPRVTARVELVAGREDPWISSSALSRLVPKMPNATLELVTGGHLWHEEAPREAAGRVLEALGLRSLGRSAPS